MKPWKKIAGFAVMSSVMIFSNIPAVASAQTTSSVNVEQAGNPADAQVFGDLPGDTQVTVDIVMKIQNKDKLARYIQETTTSTSHNYRKYLSISDFNKQYGANPEFIKKVTQYLDSYGITSTVAPNGLIVTAKGTADQFNKAFDVILQKKKYKGKTFHGTKGTPTLPESIGNQILCVLGLSDYSNLTSNAIKQKSLFEPKGEVPEGPLSLTTKDLVNQYHVQPLYDKGASGKGQTIGIVTLADFNVEDAYKFWSDNGIFVKPDRISKINVDGGSGFDGYDETSLDVEQSGALAPQADIHVFIGPNSDTGFLDSFSTAINENKAQQISVSWGESETLIHFLSEMKVETPQYEEAFNQLFMQAASQGISMFAAAGDEGSYDAAREFGFSSGIPGATSLSVDTPADSPYITAAGGTTLPFHLHSDAVNIDITNSKERAWGWDYLSPFLDAIGFNDPVFWGVYLPGGGGGFSKVYETPSYQLGVKGVNSFTGVKQWTENETQSSMTRDAQPTIVTGTGTGRNLPDLSMAADPLTGYTVYLSDPGQPGVNDGYATFGGTSFVAPQLAGLSALINSANGSNAGFWNPQLYRFAVQNDSPLHPLNDTGTTNDNGFYTGTAGTLYNQATGLGTPDVAALADKLK
ncbi:S8 family serine peptidase [Bacillus sp. BRMEA1]|uniref:S53 family peptidase n=1 Tax=Neobacillus endophyticus TaxID=2738405 RepID=UPI0015657228|nr:protease pro-enzyme activation domain-containing protein [Neobacillus endophyticus]NRD76981.1 S8 family serine peptidase [Neobacillus endophyticus]